MSRPRIYVKAVFATHQGRVGQRHCPHHWWWLYRKCPRMFADDLAAEIEESKVPVLPIFKALEKYGKIKHEEMFEIFNMGVDLC